MKENNITAQIPSKEEKLNRLKETESKFQQEQVHKLHTCKSGSNCPYEQAAIYTILLDLVQGNGKEEVSTVLQDVIDDLEIRQQLFKEVQNYKW